MRSALRKSPFRLACAAAISASTPPRSEPDDTSTAPASHRHRSISRSGR